MWKACARYDDGTEIERLFEDRENLTDLQMQYELEDWLITRHNGCIWYSVLYVGED